MFAAMQGAQNQGALIEGTFLVNGALAKILFDSGASHSFIARSFMHDIGLHLENLWVPLEISLPVRRPVLLDSVCRTVEVSFDGFSFVADLVVLSMAEYDIILGMDWLSFNRVCQDCFDKMVYFLLLGKDDIVIATAKGNSFAEAFFITLGRW